MKILAFAASNSRQSINGQLVTHAASLIEGVVADATVDIIDLNDYEMPIYGIDRQEDSGIPQAAHDFFAKVGEADALIISFAEHNGSYTAAYKNLFDWASRIDMRVYQDKPSVLLATSPGPGGAKGVLGQAVGSAGFFGNDVRGSLSVPSFFENFDVEENRLTDEYGGQLRTALAFLAASADQIEAA